MLAPYICELTTWDRPDAGGPFVQLGPQLVSKEQVAELRARLGAGTGAGYAGALNGAALDRRI